MTFLGRVFTLIILVSSASFFVAALLANASHMDYREKLNLFRAENQQLKATVVATKSAAEKLQTSLTQEQIARRAALAALQSQLDSQNQQLAAANRQLSDLNAVNTMKNQEHSATVDLLKATQAQNDTLRTEIDKVIADRNSVRKSVIGLTDMLNSLKSVETDLRDQLKQLQDQSTLYEALAITRGEALQQAGIVDVQDVPPADLRGEVLAVNNTNLVEVSLGRDDGLREGHTLDVFRGAQYLGRIEITKAQEDKAIGKVMASFRKGYIQAGDKVASKLQ
jgi:hypothetical protein